MINYIHRQKMIAIAARMHRSQESHPATCTAVRPSTSRALLLKSESVTSVKCIFGIKKKWSLPKNVLNLSLEKGPNAAIPHVSPEKSLQGISIKFLCRLLLMQKQDAVRTGALPEGTSLGLFS